MDPSMKLEMSHAELADRLLKAYKSGPIPPLREVLAPHDGDGAYAVQALQVRTWLSQGRRISGRKVGLTSVAVQKQLGVSQPDFGVLFDDMQIPNHGTLKSAQVLQPKAEAEIALIMGRDLMDQKATRAMVEQSVEAVAVAIEIVDSRIADWKITFADTVADNGSSAFYVLGEPRPAQPELDLWSCGMVLEKNGIVASVGAGAACLGHPLESAVWLTRTLASRGEGLRRGDVLLTGALGPMVTLAINDEIRATVAGLGRVEFTYSE